MKEAHVSGLGGEDIASRWRAVGPLRTSTLIFIGYMNHSGASVHFNSGQFVTCGSTNPISMFSGCSELLLFSSLIDMSVFAPGGDPRPYCILTVLICRGNNRPMRTQVTSECATDIKFILAQLVCSLNRDYKLRLSTNSYLATVDL